MSEKERRTDPKSLENALGLPGDGGAWITTPPASALMLLPGVVPAEKAEASAATAHRPLRVLGVVYEPGVVDAQGDWADESVIEEAAHAFLANGGRLRRMHREDLSREEAVLAESYVAPTDLQFNGLTVRKGAWVVVVQVLSDRLRDEILGGQLTGFSMGGYGWREPSVPPNSSSSDRSAKSTYRITRFIPVEISLVDHPANQRSFVALKAGKASTTPQLGSEPSDRTGGLERVDAVLQPVRDLQAGWMQKAKNTLEANKADLPGAGGRNEKRFLDGPLRFVRSHKRGEICEKKLTRRD